MKHEWFRCSPRPLWERPREARVRGTFGFLPPLSLSPVRRPQIDITTTPLILASQSPRRRGFLDEWGIPFECVPANLDEPSKTEDETLEEHVIRVAFQKANAIAEQFQNRLILGADTIVALDADILGKPKDEKEAIAFLHRLANRWHEVWTGVSFVCKRLGWQCAEAVVTRVLFRNLHDSEILAYVESGEPSDKAGAYAIQGGASEFVTRIEGPWDNVVGLPQSAVRKGLQRFNGEYESKGRSDVQANRKGVRD